MNKPLPNRPITLPLSVLALSSTGLQADPTQDFEKELAILRGRVDGLEARVGELEATQFSTTTKLRGQTTFILGNGGDSNSAQSAGFTPRLNFDTSFTGKDRLATRLTAGVGHTGNANEELNDFYRKSSDFFSFSSEIYYRFPVGDAGLAYIGAGFGYYYFDEDIPTRQNGDNDLYDLDLSFGAYLSYNDSISLSTKNWLNYSGIGGFGRTLRQGVLDRDLTTFFSENHINYDLTESFSASTGFRYKLFNESGQDSLDSHDHSFIQEFSFNSGQKGQPTFYLNGVYGGRSYDNDFMDLDSTYYQVNGGIRGNCPCGASYDIAGGYEWRDYDDRYFGKKTNPRFEASIFGSPDSIFGHPTEGLTLAFLVGYGVHNIFSNFGSSSMVDPLGWLCKLQIQQSFGDRGDLGIAVEHAYLEGQLNSGSNPEFERLSTEIYYNYPISRNIIITPSVIFTSIEGNSQDDDFVLGTLRATFKF